MKIAVCDDEIILYEELYTLLNEYPDFNYII